MQYIISHQTSFALLNFVNIFTQVFNEIKSKNYKIVKIFLFSNDVHLSLYENIVYISFFISIDEGSFVKKND